MLDDDAARFALAAISGPYLPWSSSAMRPVGMVTVCNDIVVNERRRIVELGGGISTILLARLLEQRGDQGRPELTVVEHDRHWARWIAEQLRRESIGGHVDVVHAPLRPHLLAPCGWYDEDTVLATVGHGDPIDLLVVDGPPAFAPGFELARYPALPVLRPRIAPGATVVLDDIDRLGEQAAVRRWQEELGLVFDVDPTHAGIAVASTPVSG